MFEKTPQKNQAQDQKAFQFLYPTVSQYWRGVLFFLSQKHYASMMFNFPIESEESWGK